MGGGGETGGVLWASVYNENKARLHAAAARAIASRPDPASTADDLVIEAFIEAMKKNIAEVTSPVALLLKIIRSRAIDQGRRSEVATNAFDKYGRSVTQESPAAEDEAIAGIDDEALRGAVEDLPEHERHAVQEHIMNGRTLAEVGEEQGVTGQAISHRCNKGITLLRKDSRIRGLDEADDDNPGTAP